MQKGAIPIASSLFWTIERAAIFSATNNTFLPLYKALAIILVIVCDFPVPGGPWRIKLFIWLAAEIASNCEESALIGNTISAG